MNLLNSANYYTQRNNKIKRFEACGATTKAMYDLILGLSYETNGMANDDFLMKTLNSKEAIAYCRKHFKYPRPNEVFAMYPEWLEVRLFSRVISKLDYRMTYDDVLNKVNQGKPVMLLGKYIFDNKGKLEVIGHYNLVIGVCGDDLVLADPFGDFTDYYKNPKGYGIYMTRSQFNYHIRHTGNRYIGMYPKD